MSVKHVYVIGGSLVIDPSDPKFSKTESEALYGHLWQLRAAVPSLVKIRKSEPVGDYEYNVRSPNGDNYRFARDCGHTYYTGPDTWIRPMCKACLEWMESEVKTNGGIWSKRLLPGKKEPVVETVKKVLIPAKKEGEVK